MNDHLLLRLLQLVAAAVGAYASACTCVETVNDLRWFKKMRVNSWVALVARGYFEQEMYRFSVQFVLLVTSFLVVLGVFEESDSRAAVTLTITVLLLVSTIRTRLLREKIKSSMPEGTAPATRPLL